MFTLAPQKQTQNSTGGGSGAQWGSGGNRGGFQRGVAQQVDDGAQGASATAEATGAP